MTPKECRKEALLQGGSCFPALALAISPPHWTFAPRWVIALLFLALASVGVRPVVFWLLLSRYMGQTVTWRIGPRGHEWWQRTVTYSVPQTSAKIQVPSLVSVPFVVLLTLLTGLFTFISVGMTIAPLKGGIVLGLCLMALDIPLVLYTLYYWKQVGQDRQRLRASQDTL